LQPRLIASAESARHHDDGAHRADALAQVMIPEALDYP
jgi:hypothetical protein